MKRVTAMGNSMGTKEKSARLHLKLHLACPKKEFLPDTLQRLSQIAFLAGFKGLIGRTTTSHIK